MTGFNKKGLAIELVAFVAMLVIAIFFFGFWAYGTNTLNTYMVNIPTVGNQNVSQAVSNTFSGYNSGMQNLRYVALMMMVGYIFATLIMGWLSRKHPIWMAVYFLIMGLMVIFSIYVSNAYETLKNDSTISGIVSGYVALDYVLLHLPIFVSVIGFAAIVLMLAGNYLDRSEI